MLLAEYIDVNKLGQHIADGYVDVRNHNTLPLSVICYSKKATYDNMWDDVTTKTRGLIVEGDKVAGESRIIARPFEKFFNFCHAGRPETNPENLSKLGTPVITDKLDGSMGTLWRYHGHVGVATKGSFHSEQAEFATEWMQWHIKAQGSLWYSSYTPVFEIVNQSIQHHVCHYAPEDDNCLYLIGYINIRTGEERFDLDKIAAYQGLRCAGEIAYEHDLKTLAESQHPGKEGFVAAWAQCHRPPVRVKIKLEEFLKLQKIAHHTTPKTIFQALRSGNEQAIQEAMEHGSPYLREQVKSWTDTFITEYVRLSQEARELVRKSLVAHTTRKEHAAYFLTARPDLAAACFKILDERNYKQEIWDKVEPLVKRIKFSEVEEEA